METALVDARKKTAEPVEQAAGYTLTKPSPGPGDSMVVAEPIFIEAEDVDQPITATAGMMGKKR